MSWRDYFWATLPRKPGQGNARPVPRRHAAVPDRVRYAADAAVLARIGRVLFSQPTGLEVRLPQELADLAAATS